MKFVEIVDKSANYTDKTVLVDGVAHPVKDVKTARRGLAYSHTVAYDDAVVQPDAVPKGAVEKAQKAVKATETVQPTPSTSEQVKPAQKPKFRLHKAQVAEQEQEQEVDPKLIKALAELLVSNKATEAEAKNPYSSVASGASTDVTEEPDNTYCLTTEDGGIIRIEYWGSVR